MSGKNEYEALREACIESFKEVYKDSIAFDMNECSKEDRTLLLQDPVYLAKTKAAKAKLYAKNLSIYQGVINGEYGDTDKALTPSDVMKAVEARNKILFNDLNIDADESNQINIITMYLSREEIEKMDIVTAYTQGSADAKIDEGLLMPDGSAFTTKDDMPVEMETEDDE